MITAALLAASEDSTSWPDAFMVVGMFAVMAVILWILTR